MWDPGTWSAASLVKQRWCLIIDNASAGGKIHRKATSSVTLLVRWELWKERNRRIFQHKLLRAAGILAIKGEAALWEQAGAGNQTMFPNFVILAF